MCQCAEVFPKLPNETSSQIVAHIAADPVSHLDRTLANLSLVNHVATDATVPHIRPSKYSYDINLNPREASEWLQHHRQLGKLVPASAVRLSRLAAGVTRDVQALVTNAHILALVETCFDTYALSDKKWDGASVWRFGARWPDSASQGSKSWSSTTLRSLLWKIGRAHV